MFAGVFTKCLVGTVIIKEITTKKKRKKERKKEGKE